MSNPTPAPAPSNIPSEFNDSLATIKADTNAQVDQALAYVGSALQAVQGEADVLVPELSNDVKQLVKDTAHKHGLEMFLDMFMSTITNGIVTFDKAVSNEVHVAIGKWQAFLLTLKK